MSELEKIEMNFKISITNLLIAAWNLLIFFAVKLGLNQTVGVTLALAVSLPVLSYNIFLLWKMRPW